MDANVRELECQRVSASEAGDYFQVLFERSPDSDEGYVLIQRQFEFADAGECYIETDDPDWCGHFRVRSAELSRNHFRIAFGKRRTNEINVSFEATDTAFAEVRRVLQVMIPKLKQA